MLRIAGLLAVVALGLSASHTKGTVGEGQLPPPGAPLRVRGGSAQCEQKCSVDGDGCAVALVLVFKVRAGLSSGIFSHFPPPSCPLSCWHPVISEREHFYSLCQFCGASILVYTIWSLLLKLFLMVHITGSSLCLINGFNMNIFLHQKYVIILFDDKRPLAFP